MAEMDMASMWQCGKQPAKCKQVLYIYIDIDAMKGKPIGRVCKQLSEANEQINMKYMKKG